MKFKAIYLSLLSLFFLQSCRNDANLYDTKGIDISHYQGKINWEEVGSQGIDFVLMKATEGVSYQDSTFLYNWKESKKRVQPRGAYHFFVPKLSVTAQIKNFIKFVKLEKGDLPPVLDVENLKGVSTAQLILKMKKWLDAVERHYHIKPIIYTFSDLYERHLKKAFPNHIFWIAKYSKKSPKLDKQAPFWQHTNTGSIQGIKGAVDCNIFIGNKAALNKLLLQ